MWQDEPNLEYFRILDEYKDRILLELAGHDHFASLRAHMNDEWEVYHNLFVAPSITPWYKNNPGVTSFEITDDTLIPQKLRTTFLNLRKTLGKETVTPFEELEFRELDYEASFGIKDMTAASIWNLAMRMSNDE